MRRIFFPSWTLLLALLLWINGCVSKPAKEMLTLEPVDYEAIASWEEDAQENALTAFKRSCERLLAQPKGQKLKGALPLTAGHFRPACEAAKSYPSQVSTLEAREFFKEYFDLYRVSNNGKSTGLFTGYYEIDVHGTRKPAGDYKVPLYSLPKHSKHATFSRREINRGGLHGQGLELFYLNDPVDAFFLHIQGSGRVNLPGGEVVRVGYAGQNKHPYVAIGKVLLEQGHLSKDEITAQTLRAWLYDNPHMADTIMEHNPSYVFFKTYQGEGPIGAQSVPLTPERSLAADRRHFTYGLPVWLETTLPGTAKDADNRFHRLMIIQDTGGAIRGVVRGDVFFGNGSRAAALAGTMKQRGGYYLLIPNSLPQRQLQPFLRGK